MYLCISGDVFAKLFVCMYIVVVLMSLDGCMGNVYTIVSMLVLDRVCTCVCNAHCACPYIYIYIYIYIYMYVYVCLCLCVRVCDYVYIRS